LGENPRLKPRELLENLSETISSQAKGIELFCKKCNTESNDFRPNRKACRSCERIEARARTYKYIRGITYEERDAILEKQGGKCAACGISEAGSVKGWHVDHRHSDGLIRAVLCATCNIALGQVNDSIERLEHLINYLRRFND
jgi:hypothetical protein